MHRSACAAWTARRRTGRDRRRVILRRTYELLRAFLLKGSELRRSESSRFPIFAFRLHQFLTRGDTVWATIEREAERHLEFAKLVSKPGEPDKTLYFRSCSAGSVARRTTASLCSKDAQGQQRLAPREDRREEKEDDHTDGYLYVSETAPWPRGDGQELLNRVPSFLKEPTADGGERIRPDAKGDLPADGLRRRKRSNSL